MACTEAVRLRRFVTELELAEASIPLRSFCENTSAIKIALNEVVNQQNKHIRIQYHYVRARIRENRIALGFKKSEDKIADMLEKLLPRVQHSKL